RKVAEYERLRSIEGHLAHAGAGLDWAAYPREEKLRGIIARKDPGYERIARRYDPDTTVGEVIDRMSRISRGAFFVAGTPKEVADALIDWVDRSGVHGFNLRQFLTPGTAEDIATLLIPELQRRGRYREAYEPGETLRERLFGRGHNRLPETHPGARYRDPAVRAEAGFSVEKKVPTP